MQPNTARDQAVAGIDWIFSVPSLSGSSSSVPSGNATNSYLSSVSSAVARSNLSGSQAVGQTADVTRTEDIFALFALPRETVIMGMRLIVLEFAFSFSRLSPRCESLVEGGCGATFRDLFGDAQLPHFCHVRIHAGEKARPDIVCLAELFDSFR